MSAGRRRGRILVVACLAGLPPGCVDDPEPAPASVAPRPAAWRVFKVQAPVGIPPLDMGVTLDGARGFVRATLVVERPADPEAGVASRSALYDNLFPVGPEARLRVEVTPPTPPATAPRVNFRVESDGIASTSFVEPNVPFFEAGAVVRWTTALAEGAAVPDGAEVEVGRWTVTSGLDVTNVVVHVLDSRRPIGPRLKGVGSPPG